MWLNQRQTLSHRTMYTLIIIISAKQTKRDSWWLAILYEHSITDTYSNIQDQKFSILFKCVISYLLKSVPTALLVLVHVWLCIFSLLYMCVVCMCSECIYLDFVFVFMFPIHLVWEWLVAKSNKWKNKNKFIAIVGVENGYLQLCMHAQLYNIANICHASFIIVTFYHCVSASAYVYTKMCNKILFGTL